MSDTNAPRFAFVSKAYEDPETLQVVSFEGEEELSAPYRFSLTLLATRRDLDVQALLRLPATLLIKGKTGDVRFHGMLIRVEELRLVGPYVLYHAVLAPRLWLATQTRRNQIFLDTPMPEFAAAVLAEIGLAQGTDFELQLAASYDPWEYVCQYNESHANFLSRWFERDGLYFFFEQGEDAEKMRVTDTRDAHAAPPQAQPLRYEPSSGLDEPYAEGLVRAFETCRIPLPKRILTRDYNYRRPDLLIEGEAEVFSQGLGEILLYGDHLRTPDEATRIAKIRAQELLCRERQYFGQAQAPWLSPGALFTLEGHPDSDCNQEHLVVKARHSGDQSQYLAAGLGVALDSDRAPYYRNEFTAIPASAQYRDQRKTPKTRIPGVMHARIDAAGSGQYAELDDQGRYKVVLPFDLAGRAPGGASSWLRMAQPSAGAEHGMHFPLHKSTEVLLTFIEGDPDRPLIAAAVPNPETPSVVDNSAPTQCRITTAGQNKLHIEDAPGQERFLFQTPTKNTWLRLGAPNDPPSFPDELLEFEHEEHHGEGIACSSEGSVNGIINQHYEAQVGGNVTEFVLGGGDELIVGLFYNWTTIGLEVYWNLGIVWEIVLAMNWEINPLHVKTDRTKVQRFRDRIKVRKEELEAVQLKIETHRNALDAELKHLEAAETTVKATTQHIQAADQSIHAANDASQAMTTAMGDTDHAIAASGQKRDLGAQAIQSTTREVATTEQKTQNMGQKLYVYEHMITTGSTQGIVSGATIFQ